MRRLLLNLLRRLALMGLGLVFALLLAEGLVRLMGEGDKGSIGVLYEPSAELGWVHRPNTRLQHQTAEFSIEWRLNDHGIRRDEDVPLETSRTRWIVLGDSHAAGHGVEGDQTFAARLEQLLAPTLEGGLEVLNFAVDGYTSGQQYLWVQRELERWRPDGLIVGVYLGNDLRENVDAGGLGGYRRPLLDPRSLEPKSEPAGSGPGPEPSGGAVGGIKALLSEHSKLYAFVGNQVRGGPLHHTLADWGLMRDPVPDTTRKVVQHVQGAHGQLLWQLEGFEGREDLRRTALNLSARCLRKIQLACQKADIPFVAALLPCRSEVEGGFPELQEAAGWLGIEAPVAERQATLRQDFTAALDKHEVPWIDLLPGLLADRTADPAPLYYPEDWHLDARGHERVAAHLRGVVEAWLEPR